MIDPLNDGKSRIELLAHMGGDLAIVNDAKASFEKIADSMGDREVKLLRYLIEHRHESPLRGTVFKFRVKAPLWVCRQWWKHVVASNHNDAQLGWNEASRRYTEVSDECDFYVPAEFLGQSKSNRQASGEPIANQVGADTIYRRLCEDSHVRYQALLCLGVSREQARGVLVPAFYTSWVWTASLQAVLHFIDLRQGEGAQNEIQKYAQSVEQLIAPIVPETVKIWREVHQC